MLGRASGAPSAGRVECRQCPQHDPGSPAEGRTGRAGGSRTRCSRLIASAIRSTHSDSARRGRNGPRSKPSRRSKRMSRERMALVISGAMPSVSPRLMRSSRTLRSSSSSASSLRRSSNPFSRHRRTDNAPPIAPTSDCRSGVPINPRAFAAQARKARSHSWLLDRRRHPPTAPRRPRSAAKATRQGPHSAA